MKATLESREGSSRKGTSYKVTDDVQASSLLHSRAGVGWGSEGPVERLQGCVHRRNVCASVGLCPVWVVGQVEHSDAPGVDGQRHAEDAQNVHDHARFHLRSREAKVRTRTGSRGWSAGVHLTMSLTMRWPEAKAMELGGVETGSMKA